MPVTRSWMHRCTAWLPYPVRGFGKRILYGWVPGMRGSFPYFGQRVFFPPGSYLFERVCREGVFEGPLVNALNALVRPGTCYFDVGANIGLTSVPVLAAVEDCKVVSFEPSPNSLPFLKKTRDVSIHKARWQVIGKAVSDQAGVTSFSLGSTRDSAFEGFRDTGRKGRDTPINVEATTIDDAWNELGRPLVSVIKSDTEGAETQVLRGARRCIAECRPAIFLEWNATNLRAYGVQLPDLVALARDLKLAIYSMPDMVPVNDPTVLLIKCLQTENYLLLPER